jgi:uncharacterized DUF497 family protein
MIITSDPRKRRINLEVHGYDFAELTVEFFATAVILPAKDNRWMAVNEFHHRAVTVI